MKHSLNNKSLITITTCNRFKYLKLFIWDYMYFVERSPDFELIVALDGYNEEYIEFCNEYGISILYSEDREGVGLSKNRVLQSFPDYKHYFFVEDDVELIDDKIFNLCLQVINDNGIHHLCGNQNHPSESSVMNDKIRVNYSWFGGGYFSVFTNKGIQTVGGWSLTFIKYKRFGHTEHSYRFVHAGLQNYPFIFPDKANDCIILHSPPSVSNISTKLVLDENGLIQEEIELIRKKTSFQEILTHCQYTILQHAEFKIPITYRGVIYPITKGQERRLALAEHNALRIQQAKGSFRKITLLLKSFWYYPTNVALKHYIKTQLIGKR